MSADLTVRYSDVMQAERDFNNLTKSSSSGSSYNDSTLSVRDARKRFEQLSSSTTVTTPSYKKSEGGNSPPTLKKAAGAPPRPSPPSRPPLKKRATDSELHSLRTTDDNSKGQSAAKPSARSKEDVVGKVEAASDQDASSGDSPKPKTRNFKTPVKKSQSTVMSASNNSSSAAAAGGEAAASSISKKLFKRKSNKDISTVDHSANGRTSNKSSPASSPVHESPLSARRRKNPSASSNQTSSTTTEKPSTPVARKHGRSSLQKSFSDKVLLSGERSVQASLKDDDRGKVVGGDRPTAPRVIEDGELKLNLAKDLSLTGEELKKILNKQLAYLSGGLESNQHLILTFPDVGLKHLDTSEKGMSELFTTIIYFKSLISIKQLSAGFTLIFDAHSTKTHNATKAVLDCVVRPDFPLTVHMVCIYMKSGLFGRNKSLATPEVCSKLHMATFGDLKTLLDQLGVENLTPDLGGTLSYDHATWVSNRLEYEKMQALHRRAMTRVPDVTEALSACSVPTSVSEAEHLMTEDLKLKENLVNKIAEAELNIDRFLMVLKDQGREEENVEVGGAAGGKDEEYVSMRKALEGMLKDLKASQGQFDGFWTTHKSRVDHMMRMCYFKRTAEKLGVMIKGYIDDLTSGGVHLGDTLESSLELGEKHEAFVTKCKSAMEEQLERVREDADVLTKPRFGQEESKESGMHEATQQVVETVKTGIEELNTTHQQLVTMCQQKRDLFIVCVKFHMTTRQCAQWNEDVLEFLASQPMESPSLKQANTLVNRIDDFLIRVQPSQILSLQELAVALPGEKFFQRSVQKTKQKYEHSCELLTNRKSALLKVISACSSPMPGTRGSKGKKNKHDKDKDKPDIEILNNLESSVQTTSNAQSTVNPEASLFLAKTLVSETTEYADGENDEAILKKRMFVYKELIATEEDYIEDLKTVINHYYDAMDDDDSMPLRLRGKRDVVFGNLPEIYKFHDVIFKKALEQYEEHPERIGECFVQFTGEFQMYSVYCKNRSNSETLLNESTESEAFFKGMQRNLGHQLPLNSYLLKPVQRITKYQLLIKDMMKHSVNAKKAHTDLQQALDRMLKVLKNLNDSLHVVGLKGFPGALAEQGRLLVHDAFQVWEGAGSATRSIFSRATKSRHVFLFEKVIIFSKKIEAPAQQKKANKSDNYLYKGHLELAELVLREKVDGQPLQFSLTLHGQNKQYRFQATDKEIHTMWTNEIRRLLQVQFMLMKDMVMKSGTLDKRAYKGKTRRARDTRLFGDSFKERPGDANSKKSISNRFKLLKKRKGSGQDLRQDNRKKSESGGVNSDSPLLASSSFPANKRYGVKSPLTSPTTSSLSASLTQSTVDSIRSIDEDTNSLSSEDEISFSEEEDEGSVMSTATVDHYESLAPGAPRYYIAISSYSPGESDDNGVSLCLDQEVEVIGINQFGWWWVRATNPSNGEVEEGWVPASYLKVSGDIKAFKEGWV